VIPADITPAMKRYLPLLAAFAVFARPGFSADLPPITDGASLQAALAAAGNRELYLPPGDYEIDRPIHISGSSSGLSGPGRIIQTNPDAAIIEVDGSDGVRLRDLTLTRSPGKMETSAPGIHVTRSRHVVLSDLQIIDNRTDSASLLVENCGDVQILRSLVLNYSRIAIDDRTRGRNYGYAFHCINGAGIIVRYTAGVMIAGNRIIEREMLPTPEIKQKYDLGKFSKKNAEKGLLIPQEIWDAGYVNNWHQGSALQVTSPEVSDCIQILGNYIENAAQGIDIHADHVTIADNIVNNAFIGMKAMHGSRNVIITGNQFIRNDLWAIGLMPGAASHPATDGKPANADGGSLIANNIISDFGHGNAHWIWGSENSPFKFDHGQEPDDPPLADVIVGGNIVYDSGSPLYKFAVFIAPGPDAPHGLHFSNNLFHPGTAGISEQPLPP